MKRKVYRTANTHVKTGRIDLKGANEVFIQNKGFAPVEILGVRLFGGDTMSWTNHVDELEGTFLDIKFDLVAVQKSINIITKRFS